jgi:oligopeptidase B
MSIRKVLVSKDHSIFGYITEREGMEYGELHFKDLNNREIWEVKKEKEGVYRLFVINIKRC